MRKLCWKTNICWDITLEQTGIDRFVVTYGAQVVRNLDYPAAAAELGKCIMHALACEDKLDNSERGR